MRLHCKIDDFLYEDAQQLARHPFHSRNIIYLKAATCLASLAAGETMSLCRELKTRGTANDNQHAANDNISTHNAMKKANESNSTLRAYKYDMEGRLVEMTDPRNVGYKVTFTYDGMGRRILQAITSGGTTTYKRYLWCGSTLCQQRDTGTGVIRRYLATGEYVNAQGATPAKKYVYFQDQLGSVRDLVDATTGTRVGALDYTPYGQVRDSYGVLPDYRYAGLLWVGEVGLSASATRFYDGSTMRWMTRDWDNAAGALNGYAYVNGRPTMGIDPDGRFLWLVAIPIVAVGVFDPDISHMFWTAGSLASSAIIARPLFGFAYGLIRNQLAKSQRPPDEIGEAPKQCLRSDITLTGGGRSGQNVKNLISEPNSIVRGSPGRIYATDPNGRVISDITAARVKPVIPGQGFGDKRPLTPEEIDWLNQMWPP